MISPLVFVSHINIQRVEKKAIKVLTLLIIVVEWMIWNVN